MYCPECDMGLNGAAISDFDAMCNAGAIMYCRPGHTPTYGYTSAPPIAQPIAPVARTPSVPVNPVTVSSNDEIRAVNQSSPVSIIPAGFWERNDSAIRTPPDGAPAQDWWPIATPPIETPPTIIGSMAPEARAAEQSASGIGLLIAAAALFLSMR